MKITYPYFIRIETAVDYITISMEIYMLQYMKIRYILKRKEKSVMEKWKNIPPFELRNRNQNLEICEREREKEREIK